MGLHHVNVLIEQHVAASKSSRDLSHRRELGAVHGIFFLTILQCRDHRCQRSINLPHLLVQVPLLCSNQSGACSQVIFISLKHPREWLMIEPSKDILTVLPLHHRKEGISASLTSSRSSTFSALPLFTVTNVPCSLALLSVRLSRGEENRPPDFAFAPVFLGLSPIGLCAV